MPIQADDTCICHSGLLIGVPNAEMGEEVKAVVQPVEMGRANSAFADVLTGYCRSRLSAVKCPRSIDFVDNLPRGDNGKLYKREIRDRYWKDQDRRI